MRYIKSYKLFENASTDEILKSLHIEFEYHKNIEFSNVHIQNGDPDRTHYEDITVSLDEEFHEPYMLELFDNCYNTREYFKKVKDEDDALIRIKAKDESDDAFEALYNTLLDMNKEMFSKIGRKYELKLKDVIISLHRSKATVCVFYEEIKQSVTQ
jgi:hypothetical protein